MSDRRLNHRAMTNATLALATVRGFVRSVSEDGVPSNQTLGGKSHDAIVTLTVIWMLALDAAGAGELQLCQLEPGQSGEWHYRTKVGSKAPRCYYEGARMKPRDELYWAETPAAPKAIETSDDPAKMRAPWQLEQRWKGETDE